MTSITIVEDRKDIAQNIQRVINMTPGFSCKDWFSNAESAIQQIPARVPDIVLMDIGLPGKNGVECMIEIKTQHPKVAVIMFTVFDNSEILFEALRFGADGYILKSDSIMGIINAIHDYLAGGAPMSRTIAKKVIVHQREKKRKTGFSFIELTNRQQEIAALVAEGLYNAEIADRLGIKEPSIRQHLYQIYKRLQINNRTELAMIIHKHSK